MFRFSIRFLPVAFLSLGAICAHAQAVSISPDTGSTSTHFVLSSANWPKCPGSPCNAGITVSIGDHIIYTQNSVDPFSIDLSTVDPPDHMCAICALPNGPHMIKLVGFHECSGSSCSYQPIICIPFTLVSQSAIENPWAPFTYIVKEPPRFNGIALRFLAQGAGFPPCDTIHIIQVVRTTGVYAAGGTRYLTEAEQRRSLPRMQRVWGDSLDTWTTDDHFHIDILENQRVPYMTIGHPYVRSNPGRTGTTAQVDDVPFRGNPSYPDTVSSIIADFEAAAFCAAGSGRGQYLGSFVWRWARDKGPTRNIGDVTVAQPSLSPPSATFTEAVELWASRTGFPLPRMVPPTKGGNTSCP